MYDVSEAIDLLKNYQKLDFTPHEQPVYIDLQLNMKLQKKVFQSLLPCVHILLLLLVLFFHVFYFVWLSPYI